MKKIKNLLIILVLLLLLLIGCNFSSKKYYKVSVYDGDGKLIKVYTIVDGGKMVKLPTVTKGEDEFLGWDHTDDGVSDDIPEYVVKDLTFVPIFRSKGSIEVRFVNDDGTVLEVVYVKKGEEARYSKDTPTKGPTLDTVYTFKGWDKELGAIEEETTYTATFTSSERLYKYNFYDFNGNLSLSKEGKYNSNIDYPTNPTRESDLVYDYIFKGWSIDNTENISNITKLDKDYNFYPVFENKYIEYKIKFYDGLSLIESATYHYGDTVNVPLMKVKQIGLKVYGFVGWDRNSDDKPDEIGTVSEDVNYYAIYTDNQLLFVTIGEDSYAFYQKEGSEINLDSFSAPKGYKYGWYLDSEFNNDLTDLTMPSGNLHVYGKLEILFSINTDILDYTPSGSVSSHDELQLLFDYLIFTRTTSYTVKLDYTFMSAEDEIGVLSDNCQIKDNYSVRTSYVPLTKKLTLDISYQEKNTTSSTPSYTQVVNKVCHSAPNTRDKNAKLYIDDVTKTFRVTDSDQLFYVLEHGYRPIIDDGALNALYNKMKDVLREIIDDKMNDYEKATAIYEWLINYVTYDGVTFNKVVNGNSDVSKYHCFYLEGVFNEKLAVCDGISKAYTCLCSMEGIPCVQVTGVSKLTNVNHAWNKVLVDNNWFIVDATSGGTVVSESFEVVNHGFLLINQTKYDNYYIEDKDNYEFSAIGVYDYYKNTFITDGLKELNLACKDKYEAVELFRALFKICDVGESFELELDFDYGLSVSDEIQDIIDLLGPGYRFTYLSDGNVLIVLVK